MNELLWFEIELGPQGKNRAKNVEFVRRTAATSKLHCESRAHRGTGSLVAIPAFVLLYVAVSIVCQPPLILAVIYAGASAATFLAYARDKSAAQRDAWRISEGTLVRQEKLGVSVEVKVLVEQGLTNYSYRVLQPSGGAVNDRTKRLKRTQGIT